jgi:hypothetical protein
MAGVPKPVLDFLLRPATMRSRQHQVPSFLQDGENSLGDGNTTAAPGGYRYGGMVHARAAVPALRRIHLVHVEIATDAGRVETPTNDRRDNVLRTRELAHALNHGGAVV